jgi:hypothetical protein
MEPTHDFTKEVNKFPSEKLVTFCLKSESTSDSDFAIDLTDKNYLT